MAEQIGRTCVDCKAVNLLSMCKIWSNVATPRNVLAIDNTDSLFVVQLKQKSSLCGLITFMQGTESHHSVERPQNTVQCSCMYTHTGNVARGKGTKEVKGLETVKCAYTVSGMYNIFFQKMKLKWIPENWHNICCFPIHALSLYSLVRAASPSSALSLSFNLSCMASHPLFPSLFPSKEKLHSGINAAPPPPPFSFCTGPSRLCNVPGDYIYVHNILWYM